MEEKLLVKSGIYTFPKPMTRKQAKRLGDRLMPADLKRVGFETIVARSDADLHGGTWFRINYGYGGKGKKSC